MPEFDSTPWVIGWLVAAGLVVVVAILAITLIGLATGIRRRVEAIFGTLEVIRDATSPLWRIEDVNRELREHIGGEGVGTGVAP